MHAVLIMNQYILLAIQADVSGEFLVWAWRSTNEQPSWYLHNTCTLNWHQRNRHYCVHTDTCTGCMILWCLVFANNCYHYVWVYFVNCAIATSHNCLYISVATHLCSYSVLQLLYESTRHCCLFQLMGALDIHRKSIVFDTYSTIVMYDACGLKCMGSLFHSDLRSAPKNAEEMLKSWQNMTPIDGHTDIEAPTKNW